MKFIPTRTDETDKGAKKIRNEFGEFQIEREDRAGKSANQHLVVSQGAHRKQNMCKIMRFTLGGTCKWVTTLNQRWPTC
jgi:hypothetical protein